MRNILTGQHPAPPAGKPTVPGQVSPESQARQFPQDVKPPQHPAPQMHPGEAAMKALADTRHAAQMMMAASERLERVHRLREETPELRTVIINQAGTGPYTTLDECAWASKSIGVLNPGAAPVFLGIAGASATPTSRAPSCPGQSVLVLPVSVRDLELGCDPAMLGASTAVVYLFRFLTVQPLALSLLQ